MKHQLLPPKEIAPRLPRGISAAAAVRVWVDLMMSTDKLVWADLAREVGADNVELAYREWFAEKTRQHGEYTAHLARRLRNAGKE